MLSYFLVLVLFLLGGTRAPWPPLPGYPMFGMRKYFSGNYVFPSPKSSEDQEKKGLHQKLKSFCPRNQVKTKKKVFTAIWDLIRPKFAGFIRAARPFFVCSTNAQTSMGYAKSQWGNASPRVPPTI